MSLDLSNATDTAAAAATSWSFKECLSALWRQLPVPVQRVVDGGAAAATATTTAAAVPAARRGGQALVTDREQLPYADPTHNEDLLVQAVDGDPRCVHRDTCVGRTANLEGFDTKTTGVTLVAFMFREEVARWKAARRAGRAFELPEERVCVLCAWRLLTQWYELCAANASVVHVDTKSVVQCVRYAMSVSEARAHGSAERYRDEDLIVPTEWFGFWHTVRFRRHRLSAYWDAGRARWCISQRAMVETCRPAATAASSAFNPLSEVVLTALEKVV